MRHKDKLEGGWDAEKLVWGVLMDFVRQLLLDGEHADEEALKQMDREVKDIVSDAAEFAQNSSEPKLSELWTDVLVDA